MTHLAALDRLKTLHPKLNALSLGRMERVCEALGRPQDRLPPIVHVAGTNGKGSTIAMLRAMAEAEGLRVHVYSSPHLVRFHERIRLAGSLISDDHLIQCLEAVEAANAGAPLTFFEATTAAAFVAFSQTPADLLILEVGLGGVLDATNIIPAPKLSVITPIDYDHQNFLGDTLSQIATEKAGIIKPQTPVLSAEQAPESRRVLEATAMRKATRIGFAGEDFHAYEDHGRLIYEAGDEGFDLPLPTLQGAHQIGNAGLAIAAAQALGIGRDAMAKGLSSVTWPGRLQPLTRGPLPKMLKSPQSRILLDGAHNPHGARALADFIRSETARTRLKAHLICGQLSTKDPNGFFQAFSGLDMEVTCVGFSGEAQIAPDDLCEIAHKHGFKAQAMPDVQTAVMTLDDAPRLITFAGSLYLVGEALSLSPETYPV